MRRGFNIAAREAGMSIDDRALILGHGIAVNQHHYYGKQEIDLDLIAETVKQKMKIP